MRPTWRYYDLVLVAIAASLAAGVIIGWLAPLPTTVSVPFLGLLAIGLIGHPCS